MEIHGAEVTGWVRNATDTVIITEKKMSATQVVVHLSNSTGIALGVKKRFRRQFCKKRRHYSTLRNYGLDRTQMMTSSCNAVHFELVRNGRNSSCLI